MKFKDRKTKFNIRRSKHEPIQVIILGAGGRDFHNFNTFFRNCPSYRVVAFTATQIPFIANRIYPSELAGVNYPDGIPIYPEEELPQLLSEYRADQVVFSYSDVSHMQWVHCKRSMRNFPISEKSFRPWVIQKIR
jgi:predicted GTPase